jgi:hypothetical protein
MVVVLLVVDECGGGMRAGSLLIASWDFEMGHWLALKVTEGYTGLAEEIH